MTFDGDIIHPRVQGIGVDAEFIETWAERKARRVRTPERKRLKPGPARLNDDPDFAARFKSLYEQGFPVRRIAMELNIGTTSVDRIKRRLGLIDRRRLIADESDEYIPVTFRLTWEEFRLLKRKCGRGQKSMSHFIRAAVRYKMETLPS